MLIGEAPLGKIFLFQNLTTIENLRAKKTPTIFAVWICFSVRIKS